MTHTPQIICAQMKIFVGWLMLLTAIACRAESPHTIAWIRQAGSASSDQCFGVAIDRAGSSYLTGFTDGKIGESGFGGLDAFVLKFDSGGRQLWSRQIGTSESDQGRAIALDSHGDVFVAGVTEGSLAGQNRGGRDIILIKYSTAGELIWTRQLGTAADDDADGIAVDGNGDAFICGSTRGSLAGESAPDGNQAFVAKYTRDGNLLWIQPLLHLPESCGSGICVDKHGDACITGSCDTNDGLTIRSEAFIAKLASDGRLLWDRKFQMPADCGSNGIAVDSLANVFICGAVTSSMAQSRRSPRDFSDAFVAKFAGDGKLLWSRQSDAASWTECTAIACDVQGNPYVTGRTTDSLGGQNAGGFDAFVSKYDQEGNLLWTQQIGSASFDISRGVAVDQFENVSIAGRTLGSLDGVNAGGDDVFIARLTRPLGPGLWIIATGAVVVIFAARWLIARLY